MRIDVQTLEALRARLQQFFGPETAAPGFFGVERSTGHCAIVAAIVQHELGGQMLSADVNGVSHWFNRLPTSIGVIDVDLTGDQFGFEPLQIAPEGALYAGAKLQSSDELNAETLRRMTTLARCAGLLGAAQWSQERVRALDALAVREG